MGFLYFGFPMSLSVVVAFAVFSSPTKGYTSTACTGERSVASCEKLKALPPDLGGNRELGFPTYSDGSIIYSDVGRPRLSSPLRPSNSLMARARQLTFASRDVAKTVIEEAGSQSSAEKQTMLRLLSSLKVSNGAARDPGCRGSETDPNAYYNSSTNTVVICPSAATMSPDAFQMLVTHELGHVVSPCNLRRNNRSLASQPSMFDSVYSCLDARYQANFENYRSKVRRGSISPDLKCFPAYEEHFADIFGIRVFGQQVARSSNPQQSARIGLVQMVGLECSARERGVDPMAGISYPPMADRVNIQLSHPSIQRALSCAGPQGNTCVSSSRDEPNDENGVRQ